MQTMSIGDNNLSAFDVRGVSHELRVYMQTNVLAGEDGPESFYDSLSFASSSSSLVKQPRFAAPATRRRCEKFLRQASVIEHFYKPDDQIAVLSRLLCKGGIFGAGLPLDAYPFSEMLAKVAKAPGSIHALDMNWLDVRHPWKTNESDLAATLVGAGRNNVEIYQRANHASRSLPISINGCQERERKARALYSYTLGPIISAIKALFGETPPLQLARLIFAADRRFWFGAIA